jgi:alkylated DNA repair dioxygenase AlkB
MLDIPSLEIENPHVQFRLAGNKPWYEFVPDFLDNPDEILAWLYKQSGWRKEDGYCPTLKRPMRDQHSTIQWGPRQAYNSCVPPDFRIRSSGPIPDFLKPLTERIEERYKQPFNSIQVNRHYDHTSSVHPHSDNMQGDIVMIALGAPRRFVLRFKNDDKAVTKHRWKAGEIFYDPVMPSGSLLTIYAQHQHDLQHELPVQTEPCGERLSMIWRYLTKGNEQHSGLQAYSMGGAEFTAAKKEWREKYEGGK